MQSNKLKLSSFALCAVVVIAHFSAFAMRAPERIAQNDNSNPDYSLVTGSKKCIGLYFDVMDTTPSNILANADQFAVNTPYLDGVAIGLRNIVIKSADGSIVTTQFHRIMSPRDRAMTPGGIEKKLTRHSTFDPKFDFLM